jgi:hypothetical protein
LVLYSGSEGVGSGVSVGSDDGTSNGTFDCGNTTIGEPDSESNSSETISSWLISGSTCGTGALALCPKSLHVKTLSRTGFLGDDDVSSSLVEGLISEPNNLSINELLPLLGKPFVEGRRGLSPLFRLFLF